LRRSDSTWQPARFFPWDLARWELLMLCRYSVLDNQYRYGPHRLQGGPDVAQCPRDEASRPRRFERRSDRPSCHERRCLDETERW
jgi:hypothetical protein